jgi:hypothetical protein
MAYAYQAYAETSASGAQSSAGTPASGATPNPSAATAAMITTTIFQDWQDPIPDPAVGWSGYDLAPSPLGPCAR